VPLDCFSWGSSPGDPQLPHGSPAFALDVVVEVQGQTWCGAGAGGGARRRNLLLFLMTMCM
jgi:hypothetical protein